MPVYHKTRRRASGIMAHGALPPGQKHKKRLARLFRYSVIKKVQNPRAESARGRLSKKPTGSRTKHPYFLVRPSVTLTADIIKERGHPEKHRRHRYLRYRQTGRRYNFFGGNRTARTGLGCGEKRGKVSLWTRECAPTITIHDKPNSNAHTR